MNKDVTDFEDISMRKEDNKLLSDSFDDYKPIQKNSALFKFILYTSKVEIKSNSFMKMIYSTSLLEITLWTVSFFLFIATPKNLYLIWVLIVHLFKGILGLILLSNIPKSFEIMENLYKNPNFEEDKIMDLIITNLRESFMERWTENKNKLFVYFIFTILCLIIDIIIFFTQFFLFGKYNLFLMQVALMFIIIIYIVTDVIYFLWFVTIRFTFPSFMVIPINNAIIGSIMDLKGMLYRMFSKKELSV